MLSDEGLFLKKSLAGHFISCGVVCDGSNEQLSSDENINRRRLI